MPPLPRTPSDCPGADLACVASIGSDFGGRYRLDAELGQGGIGVVYRALDRELDRHVALKLLRDEALGPAQRRRFEREAKALAALTHPNVVQILDCGVSDSVPYLAMELLEGQSLAHALSRQGPLSLAHAEPLIRELLAALAYVHERGLVHRDLKPANVFLQRLPGGGEQVKLLDFGLAKFLESETDGDVSTLTRTGEVFGTPAYMPPEQWSAQPVDARADVYSAAVVCFEMLAGCRPFAGEGHELLRRQLVEAPLLLHEACPGRVARPELERLLQRALAKEPGDRQRDARALHAELEAVPQPWLYEGAELTPERRNAALGAREAVDLASAPTLEQRAEGFAAAARVTVPRRARARASSGAFGRVRLALAGFVRGLLVGSAWALASVSLVVIAAAALAIYLMRSPDHPEQRAALERALPPLRAAVERSALAAQTAVEGAVSTATGRLSEALASDAQAESKSDAPRAAREPEPRDPWRTPAPRELRKLRAGIDAGQRGDARVLRDLRGYNREHPGDPRAHLLLARLFVNRGAWNEVVAQYRLAFARDPSSRGDPRMLQDLLRAAGRESSSAPAIEALHAIYGVEALDAAAAARSQARSQDERARFDRLARALSP